MTKYLYMLKAEICALILVALLNPGHLGLMEEDLAMTDKSSMNIQVTVMRFL